jgi:small subunit ribosomal protein S16
MVVIRLARGGAKKRPFYHVIVTDKRNARDSGRYIERLGYYNPVARGKEVPLSLQRDRVSYWLSVGAEPSERVAHLINVFDAVPSTSHEDVAKATPKASKKAKAEAAPSAPAAEASSAPAAE